MASNQLTQWNGGVLSTGFLNNPISYLNYLFAGLGQIVTAAASANLTLGTSPADITGASVSVTTQGISAIGVAIGTISFGISVGSAGTYLNGNVLVDGVSQSGNGSILCPADSTCAFHTITRAWSFALSTPGAHTIKLQAQKSAAGPTATAQLQHTGLTVIVLDMP